MLVLILGVILVACDEEDDEDKPKYKYVVTFNYNVGNIVSSDDVPEQHVGVSENALVGIRPGYIGDSGKLTETQIKGYYIEGWYLPKKDPTGNVLKDSDGFVTLADKAWNFEEDRVSGDMTLYAKLLKQGSIIFVDRASGEEVGGENGVINGKPNSVCEQPVAALEPKKSGYTFLKKYYVSRESDEEFTWPYTFGTNDIRVYVDFMEGENYSFVKTEAEFVAAMNSGNSIYLEADLDFTGYVQDSDSAQGNDKVLWRTGTFSGHFNGNNHTISNVHRDVTMTMAYYTDFGGIFGTLTSRARVYDVEFKNITIDHSVSMVPLTAKDAGVGVLAYAAREGAKITNVKIDGNIAYEPKYSNVDIIGSPWIAVNRAKAEDVTKCDYSGVQVTVKPDDEG